MTGRNRKKSKRAVARPGVWASFTSAVRFLTRIPLGSGVFETSAAAGAALRRGVVFFPIVGGMVGCVTALIVVAGVQVGAPPLVAAFVALGLEALLTGAFHEDAFADTCDAFGGGWSREDILRIMKDSRLGTYGTMALVVGVGARAAAIAAISEAGLFWTIASIVAAASIGRLIIVGMMATTQPITDGSSQTRDIAGSQSKARLLLAAILSSPFWVGWIVLSPVVAAITMLVVLVVVFWFRRTILRRVAGTTGDLLGSSAFLTQLVITIAASLA